MNNIVFTPVQLLQLLVLRITFYDGEANLYLSTYIYSLCLYIFQYLFYLRSIILGNIPDGKRRKILIFIAKLTLALKIKKNLAFSRGNYLLLLLLY